MIVKEQMPIKHERCMNGTQEDGGKPGDKHADTALHCHCLHFVLQHSGD